MKLFIFGSTGDLVKRKVMKALQELALKNLEIYAIGRRNMDDEEYENFICSDWCNSDFRRSLHYLPSDFTSLNFDKYLSLNSVNYFYLSLPPKLIGTILNYLGEIKKKGYKIKILSEKPFGENLEMSLDLKKKIDNLFLSENFFISDHYLFKKSFLNLPIEFKSVKIISTENVGLEGRTGYYDSVGALRDMVQSHFLNLVQKNMNFKFNLKQFKILNFEKGQYDGYTDELGRQSETETFVRVVFECCGRRFEFVTGKAFDKKESFLDIDGKKFFDTGLDNSYVEIFRIFLSGGKTYFILIFTRIATAVSVTYVIH